MRFAFGWLLAACLGALAFAPSADAHGGRGRVHFGVVVGGPWYWRPWPYYYPYSRPYDRVIVERAAPTVYVERDPDGLERDASQYWYFCPDSSTYYPYVKQCAGPWHRVPPQPQP